jgi:hypothetical protein
VIEVLVVYIPKKNSMLIRYCNIMMVMQYFEMVKASIIKLSWLPCNGTKSY